MADPREKAKELAQALKESEEYRALLAARQEVETHEAARIMVRDLKDRQRALQEKVMRGGEVSQAEREELERVFGIVSLNPYARSLIEAEFRFTRLMVEVQRILGDAVGLRLVPEEADLPEEEAGAS